MAVIDVVFPDLPVVPDDSAWLEGDDLRDLAVSIEGELRDVEALARRCEARKVALLDLADRTGVTGLDGHRSIRSYAAATINWSNAECTHLARTVQLLRDLREISVDLDAGRMAIAPLRELARLRGNPRCGDQLVGESAAMLIEAAERLPYEQFRMVAQQWELLADADGGHRGHEAAHRGRKVSASILGDSFHLSLQCGSERGAAMSEILRRFEEAEFRREWEDLKVIHGDAMSPTLLERSRSQRRADALWAIFSDAISVPADAKSPEPVVNLMVDQATFDEHLEAILTDSRPPAPDPADLTRRCTTDTGVAVDPYLAVVAALMGHVRRVVMNSKGVIIDQGRRERLFRGSLRTAVFLMVGRRCIWPGCGRTLGIQIDHTIDFQHDGTTCAANSDPLCNWHNPFKNHGYRITRDDVGQWHTFRADGTEIAPY